MASRRKRDSRWEGREESGERWAVLSRAMCSSATMSAASAKIASTAAAELLLLLLLPEEDDGVVKLRATMAVSLTVLLSVSDVDEREREINSTVEAVSNFRPLQRLGLLWFSFLIFRIIGPSPVNSGELSLSLSLHYIYSFPLMKTLTNLNLCKFTNIYVPVGMLGFACVGQSLGEKGSSNKSR